jgi:hypothetical protein
MDPVPAAGEHTEAILSELGGTAAEIEALRAELTAAQAALAARGSDDTAELRRRISEVADALARHDRLPQDRLPQAGAFPATSPALAES